MSQLIYEAISVGIMTVLFGNIIACVLDFAIISPKLKNEGEPPKDGPHYN